METHEPEEPQDWPTGHVALELTGDDVLECLAVTIHGVRHYLHSSTARALSDELLARIAEWNQDAAAHGIPTV